jgi:hypothetical protein
MASTDARANTARLLGKRMRFVEMLVIDVAMIAYPVLRNVAAA